jgi:hydrogenase maturation protease
LKTLVLGIGNLLMGDEGLGVRFIERLLATDLAEKADLVDGGTGGLNLLPYFGEYPHIILVDAASEGHPAGTVSLIRPGLAADFPATLTAHDIGLKDLIGAAALLGDFPEVLLVTVSIDKVQPMTLDLSEPVRAALDEAERVVRKLVS